MRIAIFVASKSMSCQRCAVYPAPTLRCALNSLHFADGVTMIDGNNVDDLTLDA